MCVEGIGYDSCLEGRTSERIVTTPFFHVSTLVSRPFLAFPKSQDPLVKRPRNPRWIVPRSCAGAVVGSPMAFPALWCWERHSAEWWGIQFQTFYASFFQCLQEGCGWIDLQCSSSLWRSLACDYKFRVDLVWYLPKWFGETTHFWLETLAGVSMAQRIWRHNTKVAITSLKMLNKTIYT